MSALFHPYLCGRFAAEWLIFMKKLTAALLVLAMLIPLSTAVAADEMSATPTVEEILDEYHQKLFEDR